MARPIKQGLDYFPTDTTFWHSLKVRRLRQYCGSQAPHVLLVMLGLTYQEEGYFLEWNEEVCFLVAESAGTPEAFVTEVLEKALTLGFFHQEIFEHYQILTSEEIQSRYIMATKKRKEVKLEAKYLLKLPAGRHNLLILPDIQASPTPSASSEKEGPQPAVSPVVLARRQRLLLLRYPPLPKKRPLILSSMLKNPSKHQYQKHRQLMSHQFCKKRRPSKLGNSFGRPPTPYYKPKSVAYCKNMAMS